MENIIFGFLGFFLLLILVIISVSLMRINNNRNIYYKNNQILKQNGRTK